MTVDELIQKLMDAAERGDDEVTMYFDSEKHDMHVIRSEEDSTVYIMEV